MSFSAFDKPCIPLKTSMNILFMSRNGHDKNMRKMYGNRLMFWEKKWTFKPRNGLFCLKSKSITVIDLNMSVIDQVCHSD